MTGVADKRFEQRRTSQAIRARDRRVGRGLRVVLASIVLACFAAWLPGTGQQAPRPGLQAPHVNPFPDMDEMDPQLAHRQLRALNAERQKELVKDTAKLLKLAQALNAQTQAENAETLTEAQWNEIARIEKLAHSVKERMVETYGGVPVFRPPMVPSIP